MGFCQTIKPLLREPGIKLPALTLLCSRVANIADVQTLGSVHSHRERISPENLASCANGVFGIDSGEISKCSDYLRFIFLHPLAPRVLAASTLLWML